MPGYQASPESISKCANTVGNMCQHADEIRGHAQGANVPELSWGALGMATTHSAYQDLLDKFTSHLDELGKGLTQASQQLSECASSYTETDRQVAEALQNIIAELGGGSAK